LIEKCFFGPIFLIINKYKKIKKINFQKILETIAGLGNRHTEHSFYPVVLLSLYRTLLALGWAIY